METLFLELSRQLRRNCVSLEVSPWRISLKSRPIHCWSTYRRSDHRLKLMEFSVVVGAPGPDNSVSDNSSPSLGLFATVHLRCTRGVVGESGLWDVEGLQLRICPCHPLPSLVRYAAIWRPMDVIGARQDLARRGAGDSRTWPCSSPSPLYRHQRWRNPSLHPKERTERNLQQRNQS